MKNVKVLHLQSQQESVITEAEWEQIKANGFASEFKVLAMPEVPEEIKLATLGKKDADTKD